MRKAMLVFAAVFLVFLPKADACVGKMLNVAALETPEGHVFAEMLSILINERTGTTVHQLFFRNSQEVYEALKSKKVDIMIENTDRAMQILNKRDLANPDREYELVKKTFEKERGLVWLKPVGLVNENLGARKIYMAPVLRVQIFSDFPALPRVIDKLSGILTNETYVKMIKSVESGEKPRKVARDFLKSKKLI